MSKKHEKTLTDLHRLLEAQDFKSEAELKAFMEKFMGEQIPSFDKLALSEKEHAQELVFEAFELPHGEGKLKVVEAINLDPESIEAYEYLGSIELFPEIAQVFFEKAISIGRKQFGGKFLKENKGHFWLIHETRPFMRSLQQYAFCLNYLGYPEEVIEIYEEMLQLNPNDNQGIRDPLFTLLLELGDLKKFEKYKKQFGDEGTAFSNFNTALYWFMKEGAGTHANAILKNAIAKNKFVAPKILAKNTIHRLADSYSIGSKEEAEYYVYFAYDTWRMVPGALEWLKRHKK